MGSISRAGKLDSGYHSFEVGEISPALNGGDLPNEQFFFFKYSNIALYKTAEFYSRHKVFFAESF